MKRYLISLLLIFLLLIVGGCKKKADKSHRKDGSGEQKERWLAAVFRQQRIRHADHERGQVRKRQVL